jgi:alcohol dehydrogenase class IV
MQGFVYNGLPARVRFGRGTLGDVKAEVELTRCRRALILSTPAQEATARRIGELLGPLCAGTFSGAAMHTPVEVTEQALRVVEQLGADCTVAVGGGSTTGLGKALALRTDILQIVVPTTYAGSEMTPILGETRDGAKTTQRTLKVLPEVVIYDVDLTLTLGAQLSATSGMNAIAHAVEALYAQDRNPVVSLMAEDAIRALGRALPAIVASPDDVEARSDALYGAWLAGICLGSVGMALHHKLCHVLGGSFDLPHAETHTVILPHALAYNTAAAPDAATRIAKVLGVQDAARGLFDLAGRLHAPRSLKSLGMPNEGIARAAEMAVQNPYWNPRPIERDAIRDLIARAWAGEAPALS